MKITAFDEVSTPEKVATQETVIETKVNVDSWYTINAQNLLSEIITDLNTKGCKEIFINEDGSIYKSENDLEPELDKIENMPEQTYWDKIVELINNDGLKAIKKEKVMQIAW